MSGSERPALRDGWRRVALGDVARLQVERVPVEPNGRYEMAGVLNAGRGMFSRGVVAGHETSYAVLHRVRHGQLAMRKLTAWEGPMTVVPEAFDGCHLSTEFPTFALDTEALLPEFMALLCRQPSLWRQMAEHSTGSVQRRKRLSPSGLLLITIDLPPLRTQRAIVDLMSAIHGAECAIVEVAASARRLARALRDGHFRQAGAVTDSAGSLFEITIGRQRSPGRASGDHLTSYLRAANVKDGRLELTDLKAMNFPPSDQERYALRDGDVLVTEGCGSIGQLGAAAVWRSELPGPVCFQNTLLRVRPREGISTPEYAYQWARHCFESGAFAGVASGTNIFHIGAERARMMSVSLRSLDEQREFCAVAAPADDAAVRATEAATAARLAAEAIVGDLLSGRHEIPAAYDRFLTGAA
jgi:type I restriction enzyme S subunit